MKNGRKLSKKVLSLILITTMILTSMPSSALTIFANDGEATKHDNPWDYTIFTESGELDLEIFGGTSSAISGDVHSNNDIIARAEWIDIDGIFEASGEVDLNTQDLNSSNNYYEERKSEGVKQIPLANIYYAIMAKEGGKARNEIAEDTSPEDMLRTSIIKDGDLEIDLTEEEAGETVVPYSRKAGVFSAGFLTKVYENPDKWASVLPIFESDFEATKDANNKIDLVELVDNSYFAATNEQTVDANKYSNADKLPGTSFMNHLNGEYVSGYVDEILGAVSVPKETSDYYTLTSGGINPADAQGKSKLYIPNHMNVTLQGDYNDLEELYLNSYNGIQLLGNFPKLKHVYALNGSPQINLAGNFDSLEGVYQNQGSLLLGTADLGFTAHNADIINTNGTITLYTEKDTDISGCQILNKTNGIAVRGGGTASPAKFIADGAMIASNAVVSMVDINDTNTDYFSEVPTIFSQASMSIVNCNFKLMQGAFVTRNDAIKFADSNVNVFSGFLFSQNGLSESDLTGNNIDCGTYNYLVNPNINAPGVNLQGTALGHIGKIEFTQMPSKFTLIPGTEDFLAEALQIKNSDGEYTDRYESGLRTDEEPVIYIMATGDITITAEDFAIPKGRRMIIASRNGDITFEADPTTMPDGGFRKTEIDAVFYAPNGAVKISSSGGLTLKGRIYADSADVSGYWVDVIPQVNDLDILNVREQFKLDDINYEYDKTLNAYYLTNTNLNDTITSSLHTAENVEEITYAVQKLNYFTGGWHDAYLDGTLNANDRYFTINNATLRIGVNLITFTAELENGKTIENSFYVVFFDEENLDENDSDADGLLNWQEEFYDTDKNDADTDNDGLNDYDEMNVLGLNPLNPDTDNDGTNDGAEDFDGEGLTNAGELNGITQNGVTYTTDPTTKDTDGDTLTDYYEIYTSFTDPNKKDTDGDGVDDNIESEIESNPLVVETTFTRTVSKTSEDQKITASVTLFNESGNAVNTLSVEEVTDDPFLNSSMQGYIANAFEFNTNGEFNGAEISFTSNFISNTVDIYYIDEENHNLVKLNCRRQGNTVSADVEHFSKYILLDSENYESSFTEIPLTTETREKPMDIVVAVSMPLFDPENLRLELYKDIVNDLSLEHGDSIALVLGEGKFNGQYYTDVYWELSDPLYDLDDRSLIPSGSIFEDNQHDQIDDETYLIDLIKEAVNQFPDVDSNEYRDSKKVIVIMDDGTDVELEAEDEQSYNENISEIKDLLSNDFDLKGIDEIIGIGFNDIHGESNFDNIKNIIGEEKFYSSAVEFRGVEKPAIQTPIDYDNMINEGGEGVYSEKIAEMLYDGDIKDVYGNRVFDNTVKLNQCLANYDYDGDGLKNYQEIEILQADNTLKVWYKSNPKKENSDGDELADKEDPTPLEAITVEKMFKLHKDNKPENAVYIDVTGNDVTITAHVRVEKANYGIDDEIDIEKAGQLFIEGILEEWNLTVEGSDYDFFKGMKINVYTNVVYYKYNDMPDRKCFSIIIQNNAQKAGEGIAMRNTSGVRHPNGKFSITSIGTMNVFLPQMPTDSYEIIDTKKIIAHEFGHILGLDDAYPNEKNPNSCIKPNHEIDPGLYSYDDNNKLLNDYSGNIMYYNGRVYANEIEMVLEAFSTNQKQYFFDTPTENAKKSRVVRDKQIIDK